MKVLLAEDDRDFGNILSQYVTINGFDVTLARDGKEAWELFNQDKPDICVLDVMMPEMDGFTLGEKIKEAQPDVPLIYLTAKSLKEDIVRGLKIGADDYITKPFSMEELLYRIQAILKRTTGSQTVKKQETYAIGKYTFNSVKQLLQFDNETIRLTTKESELLELLCRQGREILERNYALKSIWIDDNYFNARSMDVYITKLRKYLKMDPSVKILNVHGRGYKLIS